MLADAAEFFQREGYWVSAPILSPVELAALRTHCMHVIEGNYETGRPPMNRNPAHRDDPTKPPPPGASAVPLYQVNNAYWADATVARAVTDRRIGELAATLAGVEGVRLWHDQLLFKPATGGGGGATHHAHPESPRTCSSGLGNPAEERPQVR
jgi:hypothetical protein